MKNGGIISVELPASAATRDQTNSQYRILVVDDDGDARQLSLEVLAGSGYDVEVVKDGAAGWEALQANRYDLIITDNRMPRMTGIEMIEKLRSAGMTIPVIMATTNFSTDEFARKPWLRPNATLLRPFSKIELLEVVKKVLRPDDGNDGRNEARTEQSLRASELIYRRLFEAAKDGILILDVDTGRITDVNPFLVELLGFSKSEMVGQTVGELSPFKDIESNKGMLERLQKSGYVRYEDLPLETRDGRKIAVEFISNVYQAGDRKVIQCNVRDITEHKRTQTKLAASENHLRAIIDNEPECVNLLAADGLVLEMNPAGLRMMEADSFQQVANQCMYPLVVQEHRKAFKQLNEKVFAGESGTLEYQIVGLKGGRRWLETHASPLREAAGKVTAHLGITRDITERKEAEEALRGSEQFARSQWAEVEAVLEALPANIAILDAAGVIVRVNRAWISFTRENGLAPGSVALGANYLTVCDAVTGAEAGQAKCFAAGIRSVMSGKSERFSMEYPCHSPEQQRWFIGYVTVSHGETPARAVVVHVDITAQKLVQEQIRILNQELEQRVTERMAQLQTANEELEAFSYSVSHDLRAPLRHVMGFVDLLQKEAGPALSEKSLHHLTTISQSAKRMGDLIDDLLDFSRIGRSEMQKSEVDLNQLVKEVLGDLQAETKERNIAWTIRPLPAMRADRALLRQVLVNLISNAVKFTSTRAGAKIEIGCAPSGAGETVVFIRDNGVGFDPRYANKLFGIFQRLHSHDEFEGTGIGLANVQRILHRHGGRAWAEGAVDGGATFYFSVPKLTRGSYG